MTWINLTPELTKEGQRKLNVGQVLIFSFEDSPIYLKIMRKFKDKVWAKQLDAHKFLTPEEADAQVTVVRND